MLSDDIGVDTLGQDGGNNHDDAIEWSPHPKLLKSNINITSNQYEECFDGSPP